MSDSEQISNHLKRITGAIECLISGNFIEAATILTFVGIDQMSWLSVVKEDSNSSDFKSWVKKYIIPDESLGCSPDDLWAARNGLAHMGTAESRDFHKGKANLIYYVSGDIRYTGSCSHDAVIINSTSLTAAFILGALRFIQDLEGDETQLAVAKEKANRVLVFRPIS